MMKQLLLPSMTLLLAGVYTLPADAKDIFVNTPKTTLLLQANENSKLRIRYYGSRITAQDMEAVNAGGSFYDDAYPAFGTNCSEETAISARHSDGSLMLDLVVESSDEKSENGKNLTTIRLKDKLYPFYVNVNYCTSSTSDVIETWTEITHQEKKGVVLKQFASGFLPMRKGDVWMTHQHGSWGSEAYLTQEPLTPGLQVIKNLNAPRPAFDSRAEVMFSLDGKPQENCGRTIGAALCWGGNYNMRVESRQNGNHRFLAGIDEANSEYNLKAGATFTTPKLAFAYSEEGLGGVSRTFHRWARNGGIYNGKRLRDILLNSWEGVYFNVNQTNMDEMMGDIASLGGELFVMDDGWFGVKYPRNDGSTALGDWQVDTKKLPEGVGGLVRCAKKHGIKFGIWIEPEMTNTKSELYEKHPDWIVCHPKREPQKGRGGTQLILDMSNPKVQDFVFGVVDNLMKENPEIAYMKWDTNFNIVDYGSHYLTADNQSHLYVDYMLGLSYTLERIRAKYPDLVLQACASGGGRVNYGIMKYFDEFWVSDNTDALQRLYIQWGTSLFFPTAAMAQHVSASPNHQTRRVVPIKFRFDVAMTGRLGMEMQPKQMTNKEKEFSKTAIATYKEIRPIIQQGDQYRLISPYEKKGVCSEMFITENKDKAVFFAYKMENFVNQFIPRFRMNGLDANRRYVLKELNRTDKNPLSLEGKTFSGKYLMETGINLNLNGEYASRVIMLEAR